MTSTNRTKIAKRLIQGLAATTLITGVAIGAAATAGAKFDRDVYYRCVINGGYIDVCCIQADGQIIYDDEGYPQTCSWYSLDPQGPGDIENPPQEPAPAEPPPVLDPGQTSNPLIPVPRGPNSGTLG